MADILEILNTISNAVYGKDVRQAIVDGISQCYTDGKAGVNDLEGRRLTESAIQVNESQQAEIDVIRAAIEEMQGGGSGGEGSSSTVTTEIPSFIVDSGIVDSIGVSNNAYKNQTVSFNKTFTEPPVVFAIVMVQTTPSSAYSKVSVGVIKSSITTSQFTLYVANTSGAGRSPTVGWIAIQPTTIEVETEIVVPATDDLTQEQIDSLIDLLY